ncbi:MAG: DUF4296 domain-containing protein [Prevotellaceae bacterium]|nr:DUF4296 domain-containing protein [Prevotellaceae bacterium]
MKKVIPFLLLLLVSLMSCDDRPKDVLSKTKLEAVLYDYHLAQGLIDQLPSDQRMDKAQDYINAVLQKHGITQAQLDTTILYYNRYPKDLHKIYASLKERYADVNQELQLINGNNNFTAIFAEGGDTTDLWQGSKLIALRNTTPLNLESFSIPADTNFHRNDQFILSFTPIIFKSSSEDRDISIYAGLSIMYANGKHIGRTLQITNNAQQQFSVKAIDDQEIKQVTGFLYYQGNPSARSFCLVDNIQLIRMHEKTAIAEPTDTLTNDSINADSLSVDTVPVSIPHRLTPDEIRLQNMNKEHIKIQTAPSVRTPNSIGTRRRSASQTPSRRQ